MSGSRRRRTIAPHSRHDGQPQHSHCAPGPPRLAVLGRAVCGGWWGPTGGTSPLALFSQVRVCRPVYCALRYRGARSRVVEISPGNGTVLHRTAAAFTSMAEPVDFAVLCQLTPPCRPSMRFLFIGSRFSPSLPPHGRSPSRSWPQLVFFSLFYRFRFLHRGLEPRLDWPMLGTHKSS